jgi:hypothetical protein
VSTTRFNDAALALAGAYQAASALSGVPVYDSVQAMTGTDPDFILVGHDGTLQADGTLNPDATAGTFTQANLEMPGVRQETGFINCLIVSQTGDAGDMTGRRQRASDLLAAAEDAAAAGGGYPAAAPGVMFDGTSDGRFITRLSLGGIAILLAYRVSYSTEWA